MFYIIIPIVNYRLYYPCYMYMHGNADVQDYKAGLKVFLEDRSYR